MILGPAPVLAVIVGLFHVSAYLFIRGRVGARLPFLLVAGILGAWAGDAVGGRLGDPLTIGDFHVLASSFVAWLGILLVAILAVLAPERPREPRARLSIGRRVPPLLRAVLRGRGSRLLPRGDTFVRGLTLGALVGAAIAGSTVWSRIRGWRSSDRARGGPGPSDA